MQKMTNEQCKALQDIYENDIVDYQEALQVARWREAGRPS